MHDTRHNQHQLIKVTIQVTESVFKKGLKPVVPLHQTSQGMNQPSYLLLTFDTS